MQSAMIPYMGILRRIHNIAWARIRSRSENAKEWISDNEPPPAFSDEVLSDFKTLETQPGETREGIQKAYKRLIKKYHPDRFASNPIQLKQATRLTAEINAAYDRLMKLS